MRNLLNDMLKQSDELYVSLYMPLHRGRNAMTQDRIRLRNLLMQAEEQLRARGMTAAEAAAFLEPARDLNLEGLGAHGHRAALAVIFSRTRLASAIMKTAAPELVIVAPVPQITPLLTSLYEDARYYVLALSQKQVRLLRAEQAAFEPVELVGVPHSLAEAFADTDFEKIHNVRTIPRAVGSGQQAIAYGQGSASDVLKEELTTFFRQLDAGVARALPDERAPLVLACVDYLFPLYRQVNTYATLWDGFIAGNPDRVASEKLVARARELLQPYFEQAPRDAQARYHAWSATERATDESKSIVPAAEQGRVELLLLAQDAPVWGEYDAVRQMVSAHPTRETHSQDLSNLAALFTLRNGGAVIPLPHRAMPQGARLAAVMRY